LDRLDFYFYLQTFTYKSDIGLLIKLLLIKRLASVKKFFKWIGIVLGLFADDELKEVWMYLQSVPKLEQYTE